MGGRERFTRYATRGGVTAGCLLIVAVYVLRTDRVVGLFKDDGWYLLLGHALATGQGFRLVNFPVPPGLPLYPPGLPLVFALGIRTFGLTADTFWWLKAISIAAMFALGWLIYHHARTMRDLPPSIAGLLAAATLLSPAFVFLATSTLMAECLFAALQMGAVVLAERALAAERTETAARTIFAASLLAAFAFLTRSAGIALLAALPLAVLLKRRPRLLIPFALACLAVIGPWQVYTARQRAAAAPDQQVTSQYGSVFWHRTAQPTAAPVGVRDLPGRAWQNATLVAGNVIGGLTLPVVYRSAPESGQETLGMTGIVGLGPKFMLSRDFMGLGKGATGATGGVVAFSLGMTLFAGIGYGVTLRTRPTVAELLVLLSLGVTLLWPWWPFRFVLPLFPFILYYMAVGGRTIGKAIFRKTDGWAVGRIFLVTVATLAVYDHAGYLMARFGVIPNTQPEWIRHFEANRTAMRWSAEHLPPDAVAGTDNLALVHLFTGRKTTGEFTERYYVKTTPATELPDGSKTLFSAPEFDGVSVVEMPPPK